MTSNHETTICGPCPTSWYCLINNISIENSTEGSDKFAHYFLCNFEIGIAPSLNNELKAIDDVKLHCSIVN